MTMQRKNFFKTILGTFGAFIILCALILFALPTLLSMPWGTKALLVMLENRLPLSLKVEDLSLSWFRPLKAKGLTIIQEKEQRSLHCAVVTTDVGLYQLLFHHCLGHFSIISPLANIHAGTPLNDGQKTQSSTFPVHTASFVPELQVILPEISFPVQGQLEVVDGKIVIEMLEKESIIFDHVALLTHFNNTELTSVELRAKTLQNDIAGDLSLQGCGEHLGTMKRHFSLQATFHHLPVSGVDQILTLFASEYSGILPNLLGQSIDLNMIGDASQDHFTLSAQVTGERLQLQIESNTHDGMFSLKNPATFSLQLTPEALQKILPLFPRLPEIALEKNTRIQGTFSQVAIPMNAKDWLEMTFQFSLNFPEEIPFTVSEKKMTLKGFLLHANSDKESQDILINIKGALNTDTQSSPFLVEGLVNPAGGTIGFELTRVPSVLLTSTLPLWLGDTFDLRGSVRVHPMTAQWILSLHSPRFSIVDLEFTTDNTLSSLNPVSFSYQLTPQLLQHLTPHMQLAQTVQVEGTLQQLEVPLNDFSQAKIHVTCLMEGAKLTGSLPLQIEKLEAKVAINTLEEVSLQIDGMPLKASLEGAFKPATQEFQLKKVGMLQFTLTDPLLQSMAPSIPHLNTPAPLEILLNPTTISLHPPFLAKLQANGTLRMSQLRFPSLSFQDLLLPFQWDGNKQSLNIQGNGSIPIDTTHTGTVQLQALASNIDLTKGFDLSLASIDMNINAERIPAFFLEMLLGKPDIVPLIGASFTSKLRLQSTATTQKLFCNWVSPLLTCNLSLESDGVAMRLQGSNNQIIWTLTPEGYRSLQPSSPFALQGTSPLSISISQLYLPLKKKDPTTTLSGRIPDLSTDLSSLQLQLTAQNPKIALLDSGTKEEIQLAPLHCSLEKKGGTEPLFIALDTSVFTMESTDTKKNKTGTIALKGTWQPTSTLTELTSEMTIQCQQLPTRALDILSQSQHVQHKKRDKTPLPFSFATLFGPTLDLQGSWGLRQFSGPIQLTVNSPHIRVGFSGQLTQGTLQLIDPFDAQIDVTADMSQYLLNEVNPLNLSYFYSHSPLTIHIPPQGFNLPLHPKQLNRINLGNARIELGKITCRNEGNVKMALNLLKSKQFDKNKDLLLWFAPIDLSVQKGVVNVERTEILLENTFDVALWGKLDLPQDYVDMVLGLPAITLQKAFGIKNLPANYVLTIPMQGKMDKVQIDSGKATAKVALLLAWQHAEAAGALGGGPTGALVGGLLNRMATLPDKDAKAPPAKHPFPWEIEGKKRKETSQNTSHEKKRHFKHNEKPLKQILKVIR